VTSVTVCTCPPGTTTVQVEEHPDVDERVTVWPVQVVLSGQVVRVVIMVVLMVELSYGVVVKDGERVVLDEVVGDVGSGVEVLDDDGEVGVGVEVVVVVDGEGVGVGVGVVVELNEHDCVEVVYAVPQPFPQPVAHASSV
jgi:hypothetical protein